jgi:hypothetical protein
MLPSLQFEYIKFPPQNSIFILGGYPQLTVVEIHIESAGKSGDLPDVCLWRAIYNKISPDNNVACQNGGARDLGRGIKNEESLSLNPIRTGYSEKQGELRPGAEAIPCFSVSSPPTRVGAGTKGWGLKFQCFAKISLNTVYEIKVDMSLIKWILSGITDDRIGMRVVRMFVSFFLIYYVAMFGSYFLLPEGIFRGKHPIISRLTFSSDPLLLTLQIFGYNLIPSLLIIGANLIAQQSRLLEEKFVPVGYTAFWGLSVYFGAVVGTWSFELVTAVPSLVSRIFRLFDIVHHSGLLEFLGYLFLAVTSYRFTLWYSDRKVIIRSRRWSEVKVPTVEKVLFVFGYLLLFVAALVESCGILQIHS